MAGKPAVTVAAVAECDGRFLLVEEHTERGRLFNQPAGHLEAGESLIAAAAREALEETAWEFAPRHLVGIYRWTPQGAAGYVRFAFCGDVGTHHAGRALDAGIVRAVWLTPEEVRACRERHRSPLVERCMDDYLAGRRMPLDVLADLG